MHGSFLQPAWSLLRNSPQSWGRWCWMRCSYWRFEHTSLWRLKAARNAQPLTWSAGSEDIWRWGFMVSRWKPCWNCLLQCLPKICSRNTGWFLVSVNTWLLHACFATCTWWRSSSSSRIGEASVMQTRHRSVVVKRQLSQKPGLSIYWSIFVLTFTWALSSDRKNKIAADMSFLRRLAEPTTRDRVRWALSSGIPHQDTLERLCLSTGLGTPLDSPRGAGPNSWGEGSLGFSA